MIGAFRVLPRWLTLHVWLVLLGLFVAVRLVFSREWFLRLINSEQGIVENLSVVFAVVASFLSFRIWLCWRGTERRRLGRWFLLVALAMFVYAGEEASWGQHWFGWASPEFFAENNRQQEVNLHNLGKHTTQRLPKFFLTLGIIGGGMVYPWYLRRRKAGPPAESSWLWWWLPDQAALPLGWLIIATRLLERVKTWFDLRYTPVWDIRIKEVNEMLMAAFLMLYVLSVWRRLRIEKNGDVYQKAVSGTG